MRKSKCKTALSFMLAVILTLALTVSAFAVNNTSVDLTEKGSIALTLQESEAGDPVSEAGFTVYKAADAGISGSNLVYTYTDAFADNGMSLDDLNAEGLADHLSAYADEQGVEGVAEQTTGDDGTALFDGLETGLYLVRQTTDTDGYYTLSPFLVSIPMSEDGVWNYDVTAQPKVEAKPSTPMKMRWMRARFVWDQQGEAPVSIMAGLYRNNELYDTQALTADNDYTYTWENLDSASTWSISEQNVPEGYEVVYSQDGSTVTIRHKTGSESSGNTTGTGTNSSGSGSSGTGSSGTAGKLIHTGQLNWPIPVCAVSGIVLFTIGWIVENRKRNHKDA